MKLSSKQKGFSLTEVLLAVGTLAIGMVFIGGTFFAGIHFTTLTTERTIATVVADEAFSKIRLFGIDPNDSDLAADNMTNFENLVSISNDEFAYPSTKTLTDKQYYWSALCRKLSSNPVDRLLQVTVFISRKVGAGTRYPGDVTRPVPVNVNVSLVSGAGNENKLSINAADEQSYINDGSTIVDNETGLIYRVLERNPDTPNIIELNKSWQGGSTGSVWVVSPPVGGGRYPCIAVYQKVIRF